MLDWKPLSSTPSAPPSTPSRAWTTWTTTRSGHRGRGRRGRPSSSPTTCRYHRPVTRDTDPLLRHPHPHAQTRDYSRPPGPGRSCYTLADVMTAPVDGSGYNDAVRPARLQQGRPTDMLKLFPRRLRRPWWTPSRPPHAQKASAAIQIEVMVYGDGAFKDPVGEHLGAGRPRGLPRLHRRARRHAQRAEAQVSWPTTTLPTSPAMSCSRPPSQKIREQGREAPRPGGQHESPRAPPPASYTDLLGSLCDLTSGSGDKGTPFIVIQNYFTNYAE